MEQTVTLINKTSLTISKNDIKDYYIVTFKDLLDNYKMYFTFCDFDLSVLKIKGINSSLDTTIAINADAEGLYKSDYGEIDCVICLQDLIVTYYEIKNVYSSDEINYILKKYCNDYKILNEKEDVKKLNLKYIEK